jgi:hypothetical protein
MPITTGNNTATQFNASSVTYAHTVNPTGTNKLLLVSLGIRTATSTGISVTYGGNNLTYITGTNNSTLIRVESWYMVNPPTGSNNVVATLAASSKTAIAAFDMYGVATSDPIELPLFQISGTTIVVVTGTLTPTVKNTLLYDAFSIRNNNAGTAIVPGVNQSQIVETGTEGGAAATNVTLATSYRVVATGGSYTMIEDPSVSTNFAYHGFVVKPAGTSQCFIGL